VRVAGIDGTKGGWVAVVLEDGRYLRDALLKPIDTVFAELDDCHILAIDVPIGFGPRQADAAARAYLVGAASTVFTTPRREVLERRFGPGLGVSAQAHALGPRILHVTRLAEDDKRIREVHPEVSFRAMNEGRALGHRKKSAGGALERVDLLRRHGIHLDLSATAAAPLDDVLDAAAGAWSGHRIAHGQAARLGQPGAIWY
jgi:predicted RNase H-like nuclease